MAFDRKGRKIELGDVIKTEPYSNAGGRTVVGVVIFLPSQTAQICTGEIQWQDQWRGLVREAFDAVEAEIILKHDGTEPAPAAQEA